MTAHQTTEALQPANPARYDIYSNVHKGLRLGLSTILTRLGQTDFGDADAGKAMLADLKGQLEISASHLKHEEDFIHRALEERAPGSSASLEDQHAHHRGSFSVLEKLIAAVEASAPAARPAAARELYLTFGRFVAEDLQHMADEEQKTNLVLQQHFTDEELFDLEQRLVGSIPPDTMMRFLSLMLPGINHSERVAMLGGMKMGAPAEVFSAVINFAARPNLSEESWKALAAALDLKD